VSPGKQGFPKSKVVSKLLKIKAVEVLRTMNVEDMKAKLGEMKKKSDKFKIKIETDNGIDQIQEHCIELRNQVHLRTEVLIDQVHQTNETLIMEIDEYEKECIDSYTSKIGEFKKESCALITEIDEFYSDKSKYVTQFT
jgi:ribosomal protein L29